MTMYVEASSSTATAAAPIRVMVVDDAIVVRTLVARWIADEPDFVLAAALRTGREAVDALERADPDVVVLDIDMPELDGLSALPRLLAKRPDLIVIMASTLTRHNAEMSFRALALGAADYIPKPEAEGAIMTSAGFQRELIGKIRALAGRCRRLCAPARPPLGLLPSGGAIGGIKLAPAAADVPEAIALRPFSPMPPQALLIGASTGGPQALLALLPLLRAVVDRAPVLITQHMPQTFTAIFAEHLAGACGRPVCEASDGEPVEGGTVYLAPGGRHMRVERRDGAVAIALDDGPAVHHCKPAVDLLFSSAAQVWGPRNLALIMTGMGSDGARGAADIVAAGGSVIAQDEATSVIWGMPGTAAKAGLCSAVLALDQIAALIVRLFQGGRA